MQGINLALQDKRRLGIVTADHKNGKNLNESMEDWGFFSRYIATCELSKRNMRLYKINMNMSHKEPKKIFLGWSG